MVSSESRVAHSSTGRPRRFSETDEASRIRGGISLSKFGSLQLRVQALHLLAKRNFQPTFYHGYITTFVGDYSN